MNTSIKKSYNGWVVCPSKSFPGKFYYFNVLNGEAAWNLSDLEKNSTLSSFHKVTDKWHNYPEPDSPPIDEPLNWHYQKPEFFERPQMITPKFSHGNFQKHHQSDHNVVWIPVQKPLPPNPNASSSQYQMDFSQNCPPKRHWNDDRKMQDIFNDRAYDVNSKWTHFDQPRVFREGPYSFEPTNQIFGQKPAMFRKVQFENPECKQRQLWNRNPVRESYNYQNNDLRNKLNKNLTENTGFELWTSPTEQPARRICAKSESEMYKNEPMMTNFTNDRFTVDDPGFGMWSSSPRKRVQFGQTEQIYPRENIYYSNFEDPQINLYNLSPTKKLKDSNLVENDKFHPKPLVQTEYFMSALSPAKKMQIRPVFQKLSNEDITDVTNKMSNIIPIKRVQNTKATERAASPMKRFQNLTATEGEVCLMKRLQNPTATEGEISVMKRYKSPTATDGEVSVMKRFQNPTATEREVSLMKRFQNPTATEGEISLMQRFQIPTATEEEVSVMKRYQSPTATEEEVSLMKRFQNPMATDGEISATKRAQNTQREVKNEIQDELHMNDLRYLLLSKKKKSGNEKVCYDKEKKPQSNDIEDEPPKKKKVTFNLDVEEDETIEEWEPDDVPEEQLTIDTLRNLAPPTVDPAVWYIVADTESLLEDYQFLDDYVQTDESCGLLIPSAVSREIKAMCTGSCLGRPRVMLARHLSRLLYAKPPHVTVVPADELNELTTDNAIIDSCMQIMEQNCHVVLIVKDTELYDKAKSLGLHCFYLQEIKDGVVPKPEVHFELKKINKNFQNCTIPEKKCVRTVNENNPFAFNSKEHIPVNYFRKGLFDGQNNNQPFLFKSNSNVTKNVETNKNEAELNKNEFFLPKTQPNLEVPLENEPNVLTTSCEIDRVIQNLNLNGSLEVNNSLTENEEPIVKKPEEKNQAQMQNLSNVIRKIKNVNSYSVDEQLKRFYIKSKCLEERIRVRMEEWICCFRQIMEDALSDVLQNSTLKNNGLLPPWTLTEALECLLELSDNASLKIIVAKFTGEWASHSDGKGVLKSTVLPNDFVKIFGYGVLLIKWLKQTMLQCASLSEAENQLVLVADTMCDPLEPEPSAPGPPITHCDCAPRTNFVKKTSEVLMYLKKHFPDSYGDTKDSTEDTKDSTEDTKPRTKRSSTKIVRAFGNLNQIKIDCDKSISLNQTTEKEPNKEPEKLTKTVLNRFPQMKEIDLERRETVNKDIINMIDHIVKGEVHTFYYKPKPSEKKVRIVLTEKKDQSDSKDQDVKDIHKPKPGEKVSIIVTEKDSQSSKEDVKNKDTFDMDVLDYNEVDDASQLTVVDKAKEVIKNKGVIKNGDSDVDVSNDTLDSGFENGSLQAHSLVQTFLMELSESFEIVYSFIGASIVECREKNIREDRIRLLQEKADKTRARIADIIEKLKSIIVRESTEGTTLKKLLEKAGVKISTDKHYIRYSRVITKCLEQAQILENALKIMMTIGDECVSPSTLQSIESGIQYYNIFEN